MAGDGSGNFGGGGSVTWMIEVNNGELPDLKKKAKDTPKKYTVDGVDRPNETDEDRYFLVALENPVGVKVSGTTVIFKVPAQKVGDQVKVQWIYTAADIHADHKDLVQINAEKINVAEALSKAMSEASTSSSV